MEPYAVPLLREIQMSQLEKLLNQAINNPQNFSFRNILKLAVRAGFEKRRSSGHGYIYKHKTIKSPNNLMNFQPNERDKSKAKEYQVRLLTAFIEKFSIKIS